MGIRLLVGCITLSCCDCVYDSVASADRVVVSVKSTRKILGRDRNAGVRKGSVMKGVIVRTKTRRSSACLGSFPHSSFDENAIVLLSAKGEVYGSRVFGPVASYPLRKKKELKILSLAAAV